ncbi:MAG: hypothetical protein JWN34_4645 [Bryobacterales bacterium]|nr:hypothetical protein [Bryobacterales bacterium]
MLLAEADGRTAAECLADLRSDIRLRSAGNVCARDVDRAVHAVDSEALPGRHLTLAADITTQRDCE